MNKIIVAGLILFSLIACSKTDGTIVGTASANDGAITSDITVKLYTEGTQLLKTTTTESDGSFKFSNLESGNYYIGATITEGGDTYDTGGTPQMVYVSDEITKEVALSLTLKD